MRHQMRLFKEPFFRIKEGKKVIEVRLFDEKRQKVQIGDEIEFSLIDNPDEKVAVRVVGLSRFETFRDLYSSFDHRKFGHPEGTTLEEQVRNIRECYSKEEEMKYGTLGIHIKLLN